MSDTHCTVLEHCLAAACGNPKVSGHYATMEQCHFYCILLRYFTCIYFCHVSLCCHRPKVVDTYVCLQLFAVNCFIHMWSLSAAFRCFVRTIWNISSKCAIFEMTFKNVPVCEFLQTTHSWRFDHRLLEIELLRLFLCSCRQMRRQEVM